MKGIISFLVLVEVSVAFIEFLRKQGHVYTYIFVQGCAGVQGIGQKMAVVHC